MREYTRLFRIFLIALVVTGFIVGAKYVLHALGWEIIEQSSLHNGVISSVIFVIGFLLTATIADYKESEKIPSEFSSVIENMYEDAKAVHVTYPKFSLEMFRQNLFDILAVFREGTRSNRHGARQEIRDLNATFIEMEAAGVPANFIVKLKQQQAQLTRSLFRINYIQKIRFIPSAFILARSLVVIIVTLLLLTSVESFYSGLVVTGIISFILVYMTILIQTVSVPFHDKGVTRDDVSLFLIREVREYLQSEAPATARKKKSK